MPPNCVPVAKVELVPVYQSFAFVISVAALVLPLVFSVKLVTLTGLRVPVIKTCTPIICALVAGPPSPL